MYDICIIGGGVVGCAIARELSRYQLKVVLCERSEDVGTGATKANSAIVHGGYTAKNGTLKGELSIRGNRMYDRLDNELHFGLKRTGSLVLAFTDEQRSGLEELLLNGERNGVQGLRIIERDEIAEMEPNVGPNSSSALYCPETGITSPYEFCIALAENAVTNGLELRLHCEVTEIEKNKGHFSIRTIQKNNSDTSSATEKRRIEAAFVVNAAGVYSDTVSAMAGDDSFTIQPRQGQYLVFRRGYGGLVKHVVFQTPTSRGKGVLVTPTYRGNLMIGPNSEEIPDREDLSTNQEILKYIVRTARQSIPSFDLRQVIRSYSGIRATSSTKDFIIGESKVGGLIQAAGIDSPGLTSAPAIAERVAGLLEQAGLSLEKKDSFSEKRAAITAPGQLLPFQAISADVNLPTGNPDRIVCRCEQVREKTILDALHRGIPIDSTDAIKRRTRAGMGACQGEFCSPRVLQLIAKETGIAEDKITGAGSGSGIFPERIGRKELRNLET